MNKPLRIDYYSDMLCVWAWIAERRLEELKKNWGTKIHLCPHYMDVFGDVDTKIKDSWSSKDGYSGFALHVQQAVGNFEEINIHPDLWHSIRPTTSANAHLIVKAVELEHGRDTADKMDSQIRKAFFADNRDISRLDCLFDLIELANLNPGVIQTRLQDGSAIAALMNDYRQAKAESIKGSPTYVLDSGRQMLFGNVGYRVIHANIEELLRKPKGEASWC